MLDIKFLRQNPDVVKENIKKKFQDEKLPLVDEVIELDKRNREIKGEVEALRAEKNKVSKEIGACMAHGEKEKAEELGYEVKCASHDDDAATQLELFEAAINDGAAAIICDNAGADASIEAVQKAYDAGIPTFLIDREINQSGLAVAQIVADNAQGAAAIAEVWVEAMNYEGKYAELLGLESDTNCQVRSDNYHSVIDEYEDLEMVAQQSANWDQTEAYEKTEAILQSNPEITGIICGNDTMACGAVQACLDAGRNDIKIIGLDGSDEANAYIKSGDMVGTALQQIALITEMAVEQADAYLNGTAPEEEKQLVPCVAITADNTDCLNAFVYTEPEAK